MKKLFSFLRFFRRDLLVLILAAGQKDTPGFLRLLLLLPILYLVSPVDFIPDTIPLLGVVDDALIVPGASYGILRLLPPQAREHAEQRADGLIRRGRLLVVLVSLFLLFWLGLVVWGIVHFFF
jgi:uncharacterized membrane protein YkvA (DUF1232 family)